MHPRQDGIPGPRERFREQTRNEAKRSALDQLAVHGPAGISVNAIAKRMGVTGPALYRYFASREALLHELMLDAQEELAETLADTARRHRRKAPAARFRAMAATLRDWALRQPHRYLLFHRAPGLRCLRPFMEVLGELAPAVIGTGRSALDRQLLAWRAARDEPELPPAVLRRGVLAWTRLHGLISLEVEGQFTGTGVRPELLFRAEVEELLSASWPEVS